MTDLIPNAKCAEVIASMAHDKEGWLKLWSTGRDKRPDHDLDRERERLAVLRQIHSQLLIAARREAERQEAA